MNAPAIPDGWSWFAWRAGPIWRVTLGKPVPAGQPTPADHPTPVSMTALLDTGTSHTFATRAVFERLQVTPTGNRVRAWNGAQMCEQDNFRVDLAVQYTAGGVLLLRDLSISDGDIVFGNSPRQYEIVLGCDVLRHCRFTIDGPAGLFRLEKA